MATPPVLIRTDPQDRDASNGTPAPRPVGTSAQPWDVAIRAISDIKASQQQVAVRMEERMSSSMKKELTEQQDRMEKKIKSGRDYQFKRKARLPFELVIFFALNLLSKSVA